MKERIRALDGMITTYTSLKDAVVDLRKLDGCGEIRYMITISKPEQLYLRRRKQARDSLDLLAERFGRACLDCGVGKHLLVDHICPLKRGGDSYIENLQILCKACNLRKGLRIVDYRPFPFFVDGVFCSYKPCLRYTAAFEMMVTRSDGLRTPVCDDCWPTLMADPEIREWNSPEEVIYPRVA